MKRGNRTESLWEGNLPLRGSLRGRVFRGFQGVQRFLEVFRDFSEGFQRSSQRPSQRPSQRQISLSEALSPVAPNRVALELSPTRAPSIPARWQSESTGQGFLDLLFSDASPTWDLPVSGSRKRGVEFKGSRHDWNRHDLWNRQNRHSCLIVLSFVGQAQTEGKVVSKTVKAVMKATTLKLRNFEKGALEKGVLHKIVRNWLSNSRQFATILRALPLMHETKYRQFCANLARNLQVKFAQRPPRERPLLGISDKLNPLFRHPDSWCRIQRKWSPRYWSVLHFDEAMASEGTYNGTRLMVLAGNCRQFFFFVFSVFRCFCCFEIPKLGERSFSHFSGEKLYAPLPPCLAKRHFSEGGGVGVYIFWGPTRQEFYTPPSFIRPPPLEGYFQGGGGSRCMKSGPVSFSLSFVFWGQLFALSRASHKARTIKRPPTRAKEEGRGTRSGYEASKALGGYRQGVSEYGCVYGSKRWKS